MLNDPLPGQKASPEYLKVKYLRGELIFFCFKSCKNPESASVVIIMSILRKHCTSWGARWSVSSRKRTHLFVRAFKSRHRKPDACFCEMVKWYLAEVGLCLSWKLANNKTWLLKSNTLFKLCWITDKYIICFLILYNYRSRMIMRTVFNFISFLQSILDTCMHIWIPLLQSIILI